MNIVSDLLKELELNPKEFTELLRIAPIAYKDFKIKKKSGGYREISQPTEKIKDAQRIISNRFLSKCEVSDHATAYEAGSSIKDNAARHLSRDFLYKLDFKDFFPSITPDDLMSALEFQSIKLSSIERYLLERFLFKRDNNRLRLTIGAPSSPRVSNIVMLEFDQKVGEFCTKNNISYTRYADDLTFSFDDMEKSNEINKLVIGLLSVMSYPRLLLNEKKTRLIGKGRSKRVTGIVLTHDNRISVGRYNRKKIRAMCHLFSQHKLNKNDIPKLHGYLSFMRSVEPDYYQKLIGKYGNDFFIKLAKLSFYISKS